MCGLSSREVPAMSIETLVAWAERRGRRTPEGHLVIFDRAPAGGIDLVVESVHDAASDRLFYRATASDGRVRFDYEARFRSTAVSGALDSYLDALNVGLVR